MAKRKFKEVVRLIPIAARILERELKKSSLELLVLALLETEQRHGYEIGRLIEEACYATT